MRIAAQLAAEHSVPLKQVMEEAMRAFARSKGEMLMDRAAIESLLNEVREGRTEGRRRS